MEVVLSPGGIGDQGYNDNILRGFQRASAKYGFTLALHIPDEKEQGKQIYDDWLNTPLDDDCERSLFVFSGSEYEYLLDDLTLPDDTRKDVLMFETEREMDGIYTFFVGCYAASYLAGATCVLDTEGEEQKALVIAANPYETSKADTFDNELQAYLSNTFTSSILSWLESNPNAVLRDLYLHSFDKTNGSHVMVYNSDYYGNLYWNDMSEYYPRSAD